VVTAYDQHAIQAFDEGAIDYLLKPVAQPRLVKALDRARQLLARPLETAEHLARLQEIASAPAAPRIGKIVGRIGAEYFLLNASESWRFKRMVKWSGS